MEIRKETIHMNCERGRARQIITADDDFNVPDQKPDIWKKIKETADVVIDKVRPMDERAAVSGKIKFRLLYASEDSVSSMEGQIEFEEIIHIDGMSTEDIIKHDCTLEDITINVINTRKISVKAVAVINLTAEVSRDIDVVSGIDTENIQSLSSHINVMKLATRKKDIFRIRESMNIPSDRTNIGNIVWSEFRIMNIDMRPCEGEISVKGELGIFCIYTSENSGEQNYYNNTVNFSGKLQAAGCTEETIPDITASVSEQSLTARPDANGEMRILDAEMILDLDICGYENEDHEILTDAYSPSFELKFDRENEDYESFVVKNSVRCRMDERFRIPDGGVLQVIDDSGRINIGEVVKDKDGVSVEGSVSVDVLYIKADDNDKTGYVRYEIPFSENVDIPDASTDCTFSCRPGSLQISTMLTGGGEINIKCAAEVTLTVVNHMNVSVIRNCTAGEPDLEKIRALPGIAGYITCEGDTLWDIARRYCTTMKDIMETNGLTDSNVSPGTKLLIIKNCR